MFEAKWRRHAGLNLKDEKSIISVSLLISFPLEFYPSCLIFLLFPTFLIHLYSYVPCLLTQGMFEIYIIVSQVIKYICSFPKLLNESWSLFFFLVWNLLFSRSVFLISHILVGFILIDLHQMLRSRVYQLLVVPMEQVLLRWGCKFIWLTKWFHHFLMVNLQLALSNEG